MSSHRAIPIVVICWLSGTILLAAATDYAGRYAELAKQNSETEIEPLLNEWREKKPDDPEAWITSANYYFNRRETVISAQKPGKGDFSLKDKKTGKPVGSMSFQPEKQSMKRAADLLKEAISKFPDRLDIWCGLAFICQESGNFDLELATLKKLTAYVREHPANLKWLKGEPLKEPADKFVAEKLHSYGLYYEKKENADDDKRWFQISSLATAQYPNDPLGYNDVAGYYADLREWKKARESLEKVRELEPGSVGALINLANISVQQGDSSAARKYYEEALKLDPKGQYAQEAKDGLRKLKNK